MRASMFLLLGAATGRFSSERGECEPRWTTDETFEHEDCKPTIRTVEKLCFALDHLRRNVTHPEQRYIINCN